MNIPCRWNEGGLTDFAGRVRFRRRFGIPRTIDAHERVWLTFAEVDGTADVSLNGQSLGRHEGPGQAFEFEVTPLLEARNELLIEVESARPAGGLCGEVALEVRCSAFLRSVTVVRSSGNSACLQVAGEVVGVADGPLELYLLLNGATILYTTVAAGQNFDLKTPELEARPEPGSEVCVELVRGASQWYRWLQLLEYSSCP